MKVKVDKDACIGCGACVNLCSDVFSFNDGGYAQAIEESISEENKEKVLEAIKGCPTDAISEIK